MMEFVTITMETSPEKDLVRETDKALVATKVKVWEKAPA
jgi:hypothetical protein